MQRSRKFGVWHTLEAAVARATERCFVLREALSGDETALTAWL